MKHIVNKSYDANSNIGLQNQSSDYRSTLNHSSIGGPTLP
jgi:hypothetical protein